MPRLILFIFCIAFLAVGTSVKVGMVLGAVGMLALAIYVAWLFISLFTGPKQ